MHPVSIIVPVHNALEDLRRCVESLRAQSSRPYRLILVDDASTDPGVEPFLRKLADRDAAVTLLVNEQNLGFAGSVNRGLERAPGDVVILNSDTIVTRAWDDKLQRAAYSRPRVATVMPVTNSAGFFSVPDIEASAELPAGVTVDEMGELIARVSPHRLPETPSGCGFCMYVTRRSLNVVGAFDAESFPRGYGEENDFCFRAADLGFVHLIEDSTFVYHRGAASFGTEADRLRAAAQETLGLLHPDYRERVRAFVEKGELEELRERVRSATARPGGLPQGGAGPEEPRDRRSAPLTVTFVLPHQERTSGGAVEMQEYARLLARRFRVNLLVQSGEPQPVPGVSVSPVRLLYSEELPDANVLVVYAGIPFGDPLDQLPPSKGVPVVWCAGYHPHVGANLRRVRHVVALAPWLVAEAEREGCDVHLVERPFDRSMWPPGPPTRERAPVVSMMTHTSESKGTADGLEAVRRVVARVPEARVRLFGSPDPVPADFPATLIERATQAEVASLLCESAVFVSPTWEEGFGLPGLEALASGAALAATDSKGNRSYAVDGQTALVTPPRRPDLLADSVCLLLRDAGLRERLVEGGLRHVESSYGSWEEAADRLGARFEEIAASARVARTESGVRSPAGGDARDGLATQYIDLLKRTLTGDVHQDLYAIVREPERLLDAKALDRLGAEGITLAARATGRDRRRQARDGHDWPFVGETMVGRRRLDNIQRLVEDILRRGVEGDLIEAGTWRGGAAIFMRGLLRAYGARSRRVWVADSFQGLPRPDPDRYPRDEGDRHHSYPELAVDLATVQANFERYGLLDEQVEFVEGWFRDTLPRLGGPWALIRIDGDMYESTMQALESLYPALSRLGYVIVDDYGALPAAAQAVEDFREEHGITAKLKEIDWTGVYWRKTEGG